MSKKTRCGLQLRELLAKNVRSLRLQNGFSQEKLAEICGFHRTYIGSVERAERNVTLSTLDALAKGFGIPVIVLLSESEAKSNGE